VALLDLLEVSKRYETQSILEGIDLFINQGERIAIIGKNGGGKSTLMKIINGTLDVDGGRRIVQNGISVEMLAQIPQFDAKQNVREAIENELAHFFKAQKEHTKVALALAEDFENPELQAKQDDLAAFLDAHNAWNLDDKIERVLQEFALKEFENSPVVMLSGGEQRRVALAGLILKKPDILLLDEPTNHLDVYMVAFLEEMLLKENFTLVFISHDRYFIDRIATRSVEIDACKLRSFNGGYGAYLAAKEQLLHAMQKQHETLLKHLKGEEEWLRRGVKARLKRNEGRKQRVLSMREAAKKNPGQLNRIKLEIQRAKHHFNQDKSTNRQRMLFELHNVSKSLGNKLLIDDFSTRILQNDRIAIVGKNGAGKSTLLRLLLGTLKPDSGHIKKGEFAIGYFDQQREMLDDAKDLIETFCPHGGDRVDVRGSNMHVFGYLKQFLFPKEDLNKKIGVLSGGEKNRVALALLFTQEVDCLILDEPTNDLDIPTINILEEAIQDFPGAVLFVSHDRYFVDKIAKKLLIFSGNGKIEESHQTYSEFLEDEQEMNEFEAYCQSLQAKTPSNENQKEKTKPTKLSYKEQREYETLPNDIATLEDEIETLKQCLGNPECYQKEGISALTQKLEEKEALLEPLIERYLEIEEKRESLGFEA
jgi:ATP-binding cassette subfamily F protein uup